MREAINDIYELNAAKIIYFCRYYFPTTITKRNTLRLRKPYNKPLQRSATPLTLAPPPQVRAMFRVRMLHSDRGMFHDRVALPADRHDQSGRNATGVCSSRRHHHQGESLVQSRRLAAQTATTRSRLARQLGASVRIREPTPAVSMFYVGRVTRR